MKNAREFLIRSLHMIKYQTFKDYEVVITDNSDDNELYETSQEFRMPIRHIFNPHKGMAPNTNAAIELCRGDIIKILYLDDFFAHRNSLQEIDGAFKGGWLVSGCEHMSDGERFNAHYPSYNEDIVRGNNTVGSPSVLTFENDRPLLFDEKMTWLLDCDLYKRLYDRYGAPTLLPTINVVIGVGDHQMTNQLTVGEKLAEHAYIEKKYEND